MGRNKRENRCECDNRRHASAMDMQENKTDNLLTGILIKIINQEHERNLKHITYSRRHNMIIDGVKEFDYKDCVSIVSDICAKVLNLPDMYRYIDKAHRNGPRRNTAPRQIIVRFIYHQDAEIVISRSNMARAVGLRVYSDYPKEIQSENILLEKVHRLSLRDGRTTKLRGNRLLYNGKHTQSGTYIKLA